MTQASPIPYTLSEPENLPAEGRKPLDAYYTNPAVANAVVGWLKRDGFLVDGMRLLEPSAGKGAWVDAVRAHIKPKSVLAIDIDPVRVRELDARGIPVIDGNFLTVPITQFGDPSKPEPALFDAVVGNPPFLDAEAHARRALALRSSFGVTAFLLRLAFLESKERIPFWAEHPASKIYVLSERPSFTEGGTDKAAIAIFTWATWHRGPTEIEVCSWKSAPILSPVSVSSDAR